MQIKQTYPSPYRLIINQRIAIIKCLHFHVHIFPEMNKWIKYWTNNDLKWQILFAWDWGDVWMDN